jgi:hypothetical protein
MKRSTCNLISAYSFYFSCNTETCIGPVESVDSVESTMPVAHRMRLAARCSRLVNPFLLKLFPYKRA